MSAQQNLVPNGSFEDTITCPYHGNTINYSCYNWYTSSNFGTADHFCRCSNKDSIIFGYPFSGVPKNFIGSQNAQHGNCYAGIATYVGGITFKEYLSVKLIEPLKTGAKYYISFNISLADSCIYAVKNLGMLFTSSVFNQGSFGVPSFLPQIKFTSPAFYVDKINWTLISDSNYVANGDENYLTIGSFETVPDTISLSFPHSFIPGIGNEYKSAYYYVDDVKIIEKRLPIIANVFTPNSDGVNDVWKAVGFMDETTDCIIYNRWGVEIYRTTPNNSILSWDGNQMNDGVYYYYIKTETESYKGFIQLIR